MNDIFLSYAAGDRAVAHELADALEALGWSVWWDREIPHGKPFDQVIEEELNAARCVIVLWTAESVASRWVKTEASAAADRDRLIPVLLQRVPIPFEFRRIQTAELYDWSGDRAHPEFVRLVASVKSMLGAPVAPQARPEPSRRAAFGSIPTRWKAGAAVVLALLVALGVWLMREPSVPAPAASESPERQEQVARVTPKSALGAGQGDSTQESSRAPETMRPSQKSAADSTQESSRAPETRQPSQSSAAAGPSGKGSPTGPFPIKIGDRIEDGAPHPSAGFIDAPGEKDVYTFTASARQRVYFRMLEVRARHGTDRVEAHRPRRPDRI